MAAACPCFSAASRPYWAYRSAPFYHATSLAAGIRIVAQAHPGLRRRRRITTAAAPSKPAITARSQNGVSVAASPIFPQLSTAEDFEDRDSPLHAAPSSTSAAGPREIQISAKDLFPSNEILREWRTARSPKLVLATGQIKRILDIIDIHLNNKLTSEVLATGESLINQLTTDLRKVHFDHRQWTLLAQLLLIYHPVNVQRAYLLYELARKCGDFNASYAVALLYLREQSKERKDAALVILEQLAKQGHPHAQLTLGTLYARSDDQKLNAKSVQLFTVAGQNGIKRAWVQVGRMHVRSKDLPRAEEAFAKAISAGDVRGHHYLAQLLQQHARENGQLVKASEVVRHIRQAAEGGVPESQHNLGVMYLTGYPPQQQDRSSGKSSGGAPVVIKKDMRRAKQWFELASARGYPPSIFNLGLLAAQSNDRATAQRCFEQCIRVPQLAEDAKGELQKLDGNPPEKPGLCAIM